jgi:penicillin-binding protein 1A
MRARSARDGKTDAEPRRSFLRRRWWVLLLAAPVVLLVIAAGAVWIAYARIELPDTYPPVQTTFLYDRNGKQIATLHGAVDRSIIPLSEMSPRLIDAVIATEDHEFYEHGGVDVRGIVRAAWINLRGTDNEVQGASTITQQVVKNVYAGEYRTDPETGILGYVQPERSVSNKVREVLLAMKLEQEFGKDKILERYLNTVYFGQGAYGIEAAAQTFFGIPASELSILQSATLAGVLHAPELYDPIDRPEDNRFRRDYALDQMVLYAGLDAERAAHMKEKPCCGTIDAVDPDRIAAVGDAEYFVDHTRRYLFEQYGSARVYGGGLQVTTTLDLALQRAAEDAVETNLPAVGGNPSAALVSIDVETGEILAMVGGRNWERSQVNLATFPCEGCGRQAGSAFKAFTLAAAIQEGYDLDAYWYGPPTMPIEGCTDPDQPDGLWHPVNAEGSGNYSLKDATAHSVNTVFAQVIAQLGPEKVVDMAHDLGIQSDLPPFCSITLGSVAVSPLEMANAYATLAARGERHWATPVKEVKTASGRIDRSIRNRPEQVLSENDADLVTYALQGVVTGGTGTGAAVPGYQVAGKTGSAQDNVDAWFCGYTVQIATCVWIGYPRGEIPLEDVQGVPLVYGGTIPADIFADYMAVAMDGLDPLTFPTPVFDGYVIGPDNPAPSPTPPPPPVTSSPIPTEEPEPTEDPSPTEPAPTDEPTDR